MLCALKQGELYNLYDNRGEMVLRLLYDILNKYCVIESLKLKEFEKYCNELGYLTVAADIISQ